MQGIKPVMATILAVPLFPQIAGAKASDGYNTTGAIFCQRLQGIKPVMATIVLVPFFATDCGG